MRCARLFRLAGLLAIFALVADSRAAEPRISVIVMVADGAGYSAWEAAGYYQGADEARFCDGEDWVRLAAATYALRDHAEVPVGAAHARVQLPSLVYDPIKAWDPRPAAGGSGDFPYFFEGYRWLRHAPDSANTASALATGVKTFKGAINVDGAGEPVEETLAGLARRAGKRVGVVSSVAFNHATPAAFGGAHQRSRGEYCRIAWEMLTRAPIDLLVGAGNPGFDNNGKAIVGSARPVYRDVGDEKIWGALTGATPLEVGQSVCGPPAADDLAEKSGVAVTAEDLRALGDWTLLQGKDEIEALLEGSAPKRLLIVPEVGRSSYWGGWTEDPDNPDRVKIGGTLQQQRGSRANPEYTAPGDDPLISTVPSLETLTRVALHSLGGPKGFFLHVEGGAVDWAMHGNQLGRMIEELVDFERAVQAVIEWVDARDGWDRTLLVVTADHDHLLAGPHSDKIPFQPLVDRGPGRMPAYRWLSDGHSSHLVPLYARGVGAKSLRDRVEGRDPYRGDYLHQTAVFEVMKRSLAGGDPPE